MVNLTCKVAALNAGLDMSFFQSARFADLLRGHFRRGSGADIDLDVQFQAIQPVLAAGEQAIDGDLHFGLRRLLQNSSSPPINTIGLLVASRHQADNLMFGLMFDRGIAQIPGDFNAAVPREGAAIFVDAIASRRTPAEIESECAFTSVHELGHAFNLWHVPQQPPTFMSRSALNSQAYGGGAFFFATEHADWLKNCSTDVRVRPGGSVFIERDVANSGNTAARQRDPRLSLRIGVHPAESTPFEPIHLDITIKPARTHEGTPIRLPRMLDPAHQSFRIYIRDPRGNTWRYRNTTHCCPSARTIQITRERPFRRDIVVMAEQGRYTFRDPGIYRLHVEYDVGKRHTLRSNTAEVLVRAESPRDRQWRSTLGVLKSPAAVQLLQYRRTHSARLLDRMALMIDAWKGPWDERKSLIAYRWARAVIDSRWTQRMERKTATALRYLDKCRYLQSHREARVAEMMAAPGAGARTA